MQLAQGLYKEENENMNKVLTLSVIRDADRILLGMKKRGFGAGRWNGFGGKVEEGEDVEASLRRECMEEAGITLGDITECGHFTFYYEGKDTHDVRAFLVASFSGEPGETEEMKPQWFDLKDIPYDSMWPDDKYWLPRVLAGEKLRGEFWFDRDNKLLRWDIQGK